MSQIIKKIKSRVSVYRNNLVYFLLSRLGITIRQNGLREDVVQVTRQLSDHIISFYPHDQLGRYIYLKGEWARDSFDKVIELLLQNQLLDKKKAVIEFGANIGTQTIYLHLSERFSQVIAVEADPNNAKILRQNLEQNNMLKKSILVECAISEKIGKTQLFLCEKNCGAHSLFKLGRYNNAVEVDAKTLNKILDENNIKPRDIGFCWVDLEGYEFEVMKQIVETLGTEIPVFTEFSPKIYGGDKTQDFLKFIKTHYSNCYIFDKGKVSEKNSTQEIPNQLGQFDILLIP